MSNTRTRYDLTAADTKIIGIDYQYFYFIDSILSIRKGQSIGYEVKDDVHISLSTGGLVLIQVKHTVQQNAQLTSINLTEKDEDLWKTLSNWAQLICDTNDGRSSFDKQKDFIKNTKFLLATNKTQSPSNKFLTILEKIKSVKISIDDLIIYLNKLSTDTKDVTIKSYIDDLIKMNSILLRDFLLNTDIEFHAENIIESIKLKIAEKNIGSSRINDVFNGIFSELKQDFFSKVQIGSKQIITYDDWYKKYTVFFENYRTTTLPIRKFSPIIKNDSLSEQAFIKELVEIGDIEPNDFEQIAQFTSFMLEIKQNLQQWYDDGEITSEQKERFHRNATMYWINIHRQCHRATKNNPSLDHAQAIDCLDEIRRKELKMVNTELQLDVSNGEFYLLSNEGELGWLKKWEDVYKK